LTHKSFLSYSVHIRNKLPIDYRAGHRSALSNRGVPGHHGREDHGTGGRDYRDLTEYFEILAFIHMHQAEPKVKSHMSFLLDEEAIELLNIIEEDPNKETVQ
jgi:hypothetical protein